MQCLKLQFQIGVATSDSMVMKTIPKRLLQVSHSATLLTTLLGLVASTHYAKYTKSRHYFSLVADP